MKKFEENGVVTYELPTTIEIPKKLLIPLNDREGSTTSMHNLSMAQSTVLTLWFIKKMKCYGKAYAPSPQLATDCSKDLGFEVNERHINTRLREFGIKRVTEDSKDKQITELKKENARKDEILEKYMQEQKERDLKMYAALEKAGIEIPVDI